MIAIHCSKFGPKVGLLGFAMLFGTAAQAQQYTLTDLGTLGGTASYATGINSAGQVVGQSNIIGNAAIHATVWNSGVATDLGTLGGTNSYANDINAAGQVVGYSQFNGNPDYTHTALWNGTEILDLGTLSFGTSSIAKGINETGQVIGHSLTNYNTIVHATLWNSTTATDLSAQIGFYTTAVDINSSGQVVGVTYKNTTHLATLWNGSTTTTLGTLGGTYSEAEGINDAGLIVGMSGLPGNDGYGATLWSGDAIVNLGTFASNASSQALDINNVGQIVGQTYSGVSTGSDPEHRATLWSGGIAMDLNLAISDPLGTYVTLTDAVAINDNGWIAANGIDSRTGQQHAYLLTVAPVPLPAASVLFMSGLGCLGAFVRRRRVANLIEPATTPK